MFRETFCLTITRFESWFVIDHCGRRLICTLKYGLKKKNPHKDDENEGYKRNNGM